MLKNISGSISNSVTSPGTTTTRTIHPASPINAALDHLICYERVVGIGGFLDTLFGGALGTGLK